MKIDGLQSLPFTNQNIVNKPDLDGQNKVQLEPMLVSAISEIVSEELNQDQILLKQFQEVMKIKVTLFTNNAEKFHAIVALADNKISELFSIAYKDGKILLEGAKQQFYISDPSDFLIKFAATQEKVFLQFFTNQEALLFDKIHHIQAALPLQNQEILPNYRAWQGFFLPISQDYQIKVFTRSPQKKKRFLLVISDNPLFILDIFFDEEQNPPNIIVIVRSYEILNFTRQKIIKQALLEVMSNMIAEIIFNAPCKTLPELLDVREFY